MALAGTLKDVVPRYWTMKGYQIPRRFGWDCHGLPVEYEINKSLNIKSNKDVHAMGIAAEARSRRYGWSMTAARLRRLYIDLLAREPVSCR